MKKKEIENIINENLENKYHMNNRLSKAKENLKFNNSNNKNIFVNKKFMIAYSTFSVIIILCLIVTNIAIYSFYNSNINHTTTTTDEEYINIANDKIEEHCDLYRKLPIITYNLDDDFCLYVYKGIDKISNENLYFCHFRSNIGGNYLVDIDFYNSLDQHLVINNIKDKYFCIITSIDFNTNNDLSFSYYKFNEYIFSCKIF